MIFQIELDLLRTLPHNKHFENVHADGIPKLRRILLAFSRHNPDIGYCQVSHRSKLINPKNAMLLIKVNIYAFPFHPQGLNRLGGIALLFLQEEEAFWCLVSIVEILVPCDYYTRDLIGAQVDQVTKELTFTHFIMFCT